MYSYEESLKLSTEYFGGEVLPAKVFIDKYALRDIDNNLLEATPDDMHKRLAREFARIESNKFKQPFTYDEIYNLFYNFSTIIPQGSPIYAIGNPYQYVSASNCFVLTEPEDSYSSILSVDEELVNISKRRGGVGISLNNLRPAGSRTNNAAKSSTGILSWMNRYSNSIREVGQCIAEDNTVLTKSGIKKIQNVTNTDLVWTEDGWTKNLELVNNGTKYVYRITTNRGYTIECTDNHILLDGNLQEKQAGDFLYDDEIVIIPGTTNVDQPEYVKLNMDYEVVLRGLNKSNRLQDSSPPELLDENLAYLLGYSYGDGSIERNKYEDPITLSLACSHDYPEIESKLTNIIKLYRLNPVVRHGDGALNIVDICNKDFITFLGFNELLKQKSGRIIFPEKISNSPISVKMSFIAGYFDADGCAKTVKKGGYSITSINQEFLLEVQKIIMEYGVVSTLHFEKVKEPNWKDKYRLTVTGNYAQSQFLAIMNDFCVKTKKMNIVNKRDYTLTPYSTKTFGIKRGTRNNYFNGDDRFSCGIYTRIKEEFNTKKEMLVVDHVKSIEAIGYKTVYDLRLESTHMFYCNGFYVHNSGRRGALMLTLNVHHPDIEAFICAKNDDISVTGANISVHLTDEFLDAVKNDTEYEQRFPIHSTNPKISKKVKAKDVWKKIIHNAWLRAEPGLQFIDNVYRESPADCYAEFGYRTVTSNPCGEIFLSVKDSCRLLAINLMRFVIYPFTEDAHFDYEEFYETAQIAQRLMDDLVDLELECIDRIIGKIQNDPESAQTKQRELNLWLDIRKVCENGRRTGLGITALGDALAALGIEYGSDESIKVTEKIYKTLKFGSYRSSIDMSRELGAFPVWDWELEKDNPFISRIAIQTLDLGNNNIICGEKLYRDIEKYGRRNIANLTTAPTGTISMLAGYQVNLQWFFGTSSGIEPIFKKVFTRRKKGNPGDIHFRTDFIDKSGDHWMEFPVYHAGMQAYMITNPSYNPSDCKYIEANDVVWTQRVKMQAAAQQHVDHSISVTCNVPENISEEEVAKIYEEAWTSGCKGFTIYRENCRSGVLIDSSKAAVNQNLEDRPKELPCEVYHTSIKGQSYFVLIGMMNDKPYEVFAGKNGFIDKEVKAGKIIRGKKRQYKAILSDETEISPITASCTEHEETITRLSSALLRSGATILEIVQQLERVNGDMHSFAKGLARILKKYIENDTIDGEKCPECGAVLVRNEGCLSCKSCSFSKCG